jgi:hypothetical protein
MTSLYSAQYKNRLQDSGVQPLESVDQTPATFGEGVAAAFRYARDEGLTISQWRAWDPYYDARDQAYKELTGEDSAATYWTQQEPWYPEARDMARTGEISLDGEELALKSPRAQALAANVSPVYLRSIAKREALHRLYPDRILSDEQIAEKVKADLKVRREANQRVMARADSTAAELVGTAAGLVTDPLVLATLPLGPEWQGGKMLMNVLRGAGGEFVIGAGTEAVIQASVYDFKRAIESPYTKAEAVLNVLAAGLGGAVLRGTGSVAIDAATALRRALDTSGAARLLAEAGVDPSLAARIADELVTREATRPMGMDPIAHSDAIDRAVTQVGEGRIADPPADPAAVARVAEDAATRAEASQFLDARVAELLPIAGNRLERGARLELVGAIKRAEFDAERAASEARLREITDEIKASGVTGRKAKAAATKQQAAEVQKLRDDVEQLQRRLAKDDEARAAEAEVSRIEQGRADPVKTATRYGFEDPRPLRNAIREAVDAVRQSEPDMERSAAVNLAERVAAEPPPKPKVDKGAVPETLRAEPARAEAEPARPEPAKAEAAPEPVRPVLRAVEQLPDVPVAIAERADGSLEAKPVRELIAELDDELRAIDQLEACVLKEAA